VRDAKTGAVVVTLVQKDEQAAGPAVSVAFSPDGELVATGNEGAAVHVRVWRVRDGALVEDLDAGVPPGAYGSAVVAFTPNGDFVAAGLRERFPGEDWAGEIRFWDRASGDIAAEYADSAPGQPSGGVTYLAFSPGRDHEFAYAIGGAVKVAVTALSLATRTLGVAPSGEVDELSLAAPNPSPSQLSFLFTPSVDRHVSVEALDLQGYRVASVFDGDVRAGVPALWTLDGEQLAAGQYLVHVHGEGLDLTREVVLAK